MAEWLFVDESKVLNKLGIIYREVVGVFHRGEIEVFFDKLWQTFIHEKVEQLDYELNFELPHSSLLWVTLEIVRQWGQQQKLSVTETEKRLKALRRALEKLVEVEVLSVYCLVSHLIPYFYIAELKVVDSPKIMTIITGKRLQLAERIPIGLFKLTPLAKELHVMEWRKKILGGMGALSKWKTAKSVTGKILVKRARKKLWKLVFGDDKDLVIPISISDLLKIVEVQDREKVLRDYPYLRSDPVFNSLQDFFDEDEALEAAVNAAEIHEVEKSSS